jgi:hypothetical protein
MMEPTWKAGPDTRTQEPRVWWEEVYAAQDDLRGSLETINAQAWEPVQLRVKYLTEALNAIGRAIDQSNQELGRLK